MTDDFNDPKNNSGIGFKTQLNNVRKPSQNTTRSRSSFYRLWTWQECDVLQDVINKKIKITNIRSFARRIQSKLPGRSEAAIEHKFSRLTKNPQKKPKDTQVQDISSDKVPNHNTNFQNNHKYSKDLCEILAELFNTTINYPIKNIEQNYIANINMLQIPPLNSCNNTTPKIANKNQVQFLNDLFGATDSFFVNNENCK